MRWLLPLYPGDEAMLVLGNAAAQVIVIVLMAWLAAAVLGRRNAALRYAVYLVALVILLSSPVLFK